MNTSQINCTLIKKKLKEINQQGYSDPSNFYRAVLFAGQYLIFTKTYTVDALSFPPSIW